MFYRFNGLAGRIVAVSNLQSPLFPVRPVPLNKADVSKVISDSSIQWSMVAPASTKSGSSLDNDDRPTVPEHIKRAQAHFQKDDGLPVYLKGGMKDRIMFGITLALIATGLPMMFHFIITEAQK